MKTLKLSLISVLLVGIFIHHAEAVSRLVLGSDARMMRTIIVSPGESETDGGTTLLNALASVTGTIDSPYLIKIEPGHYDLGDVSLVMKPYIDIEGSGQAATVISSSCSQGVILGSSPCELRELTVVNTYDGAAAAYGISTNGYSPVIRNVTVDISRGCSYPTGIYNNVAGTVLSGVTVLVDGLEHSYGIHNVKSTSAMRVVDIEATCSGEDHKAAAISIEYGDSTAGPDRLENIRAVARGGYSTVCLEIKNSSVEVKDLECQARDGGNSNCGISIQSSSGPVTLAHSSAVAQGGNTAVGIEADNTALTLINVIAEGSGATGGNVGFSAGAADSSLEINIRQSSLRGEYRSVNCSDSDYTFHIGASHLDGPVAEVGTWHCVHCYDGAYFGLDIFCQPWGL